MHRRSEDFAACGDSGEDGPFAHLGQTRPHYDDSDGSQDRSVRLSRRVCAEMGRIVRPHEDIGRGEPRPIVLYKPSFLESLKGAALSHRLQAFCRYIYRDFLAEFGNEDRFLLDIHQAAACPRRVELGRTRAVRIPAADLRFLACDDALLCHSGGILTHVDLARQLFLSEARDKT